MKNFIMLLLVAGVFANVTFAQTLSTISQFCHGGTQNDIGLWGEMLPDGTRLFGGMTNSNNIDVSGLHSGSTDAWVIKTDASGLKLFQRCIGGSDFDLTTHGAATSDGGAIVVGQANSADGDFQGQHKGVSDAFIAKLDAQGTLQWVKLIGGSNSDLFQSVWPISTGGYIAVGETNSTDGDITDYHGGTLDMLVVRFDEQGNVVWKKTFGGTNYELAQAVWKTNDNNFILIGTTGSTDGDFPVSVGTRDVVLLKISPNGDKLWAHTYGGNSFDRGVQVRQLPNNEYIALCSSQSNDGITAGNHGLRDIWVFRTNQNGDFLSHRCMGGSDNDDPSSLEIMPTGNLLISGISRSNDGEVNSPVTTGNSGWMFQLTPLLIPASSLVMNNPGDFPLVYAAPTPTGNLWGLGISTGINGDVTCAKGFSDFWSFELAAPVGTQVTAENDRFTLSPNPSADQVALIASSLSAQQLDVKIFNHMGQLMGSQSGYLDQINAFFLAELALNSGIYWVQIRDQASRVHTLKFIKL
jgi:Secretion system C-terminal sorting domain